KTIPKRLLAGETVDLIGADGLPLVETHLLPECDDSLTRGTSGYSTLSTPMYSAVELSSEELPWPVKLEAEYAIPHNHAHTSFAGAYVGGKLNPTVGGKPCQSLIQLIHRENHVVRKLFGYQLDRFVVETAAFESAIWNPKAPGARWQFNPGIPRTLPDSAQ